jgi:hypothetical protein
LSPCYCYLPAQLHTTIFTISTKIRKKAYVTENTEHCLYLYHASYTEHCLYQYKLITLWMMKTIDRRVVAVEDAQRGAAAME